MGLNEVLFGFLAAFALAAACAVLFVRNTVYAALFFVAHLLALAGIYALMNAPLLAVVQVMVYGGAIMVLFVFAIMILDANELEKLAGGDNVKSLVWAGALATGMVGAFFGLSNRFHIKEALAAEASPGSVALWVDNVSALGRMLYRDYFFAFELTGMLLFVAVVGIMVMAKRRLE